MPLYHIEFGKIKVNKDRGTFNTPSNVKLINLFIDYHMAYAHICTNLWPMWALFV